MRTSSILDCNTSTIINVYRRVTKPCFCFYSPYIQLVLHLEMTKETYSIFPLLSIIKSRVRSEPRDLTFLGHHFERLLYFVIEFV